MRNAAEARTSLLVLDNVSIHESVNQLRRTGTGTMVPIANGPRHSTVYENFIGDHRLASSRRKVLGMDVSASWVPVVAMPGLVIVFGTLFAYDVYRTQTGSSSGAQKRMLSELMFNAFMGSCCVLFAGGVLFQLARWLLPLLTGDLITALITIIAGSVGLAALRAFSTHAADLPTDPIPDFMRCDGEFVAVTGYANPLSSWCGWIRFEGHGACRIQASADASSSVSGDWHVMPGGNALRIALRGQSHPTEAVAELFVSGGDASLTDATVNETVEVSLTAAGQAACRFSFVPDEAHND